MKIKNLFLCLFFLYVINAFCQTQDYNFKNIDISDGLSQNSVIDIHQDQKGQMWFGTLDGLNVFNGHDFKVFKNVYNDSTSLYKRNRG